jgi:hypothetical protein
MAHPVALAVLAALLLATCGPPAAALDDGLARKPIMGCVHGQSDLLHSTTPPAPRFQRRHTHAAPDT